MSDLTELGLKTPLTEEASRRPEPPDRMAPVESLVDRRPERLARFVDRLLECLGRLAPATDEGQRERFEARLEELRRVVVDPSRGRELPAVADECLDTCRRYLEDARTYQCEREQELREVITLLRDAAKLSVGDAAHFHAQVLATSDRFTAIAALENIRELRKRMGDEVSSLRRAVEEKQQRDDHAYAQLTTRVETLQNRLAEMEVEASIDPLTRVGNRRRFDTALARMAAAAQQSGNPLSLAMIDVDHFKQVNDVHGHPVGDRVLVCVAQFLSKAVRQTDVVTRYGGEEFAVLLTSASVPEVEGRMKHLLAEIAASAYEYEVLGHREQVRFTVSCGLVDLAAGESPQEFVTRADEALYEAKKKGRNRVVSRKRSVIGRMLAWG